MKRLTRSYSPRVTDHEPETQEALLGEQSLVDADHSEIENVINMAPGQETGICTRTPRVSTSVSVEEANRKRERAESTATANEEGENEGDRLIEKSE